MENKNIKQENNCIIKSNFKKLNPIGRLCINVGMIPTSYTESMTYEEQILWLCNFYDTKILPTVNNNLEETKTILNDFENKLILFNNTLKEYKEIIDNNTNIINDYINKFNELVINVNNQINTFKTEVNNQIDEFEISINTEVEGIKTYVNNYFNNLDLNSEVTTIIDKLVENGTMANIMNEEILKNKLDYYKVLSTMSQSEIQEIFNNINAKVISFEKGEYNLTEPIVINSNTTVLLNDSTIASNETCFQNYTDNSSLYGYEGNNNIIINGGTINGSLKFAHCKNIKILNCNITPVFSHIAMHTLSVYNLEIKNCNFNITRSGTSYGTITNTTYRMYINDDETISYNYIIENCIFSLTNGAPAIDLSLNTDRLTVKNSECRGGNGFISYMGSKPCYINNCNINNTSTSVKTLIQATHLKLENSILKNGGISLSEGKHIISNNYIEYKTPGIANCITTTISIKCNVNINNNVFDTSNVSMLFENNTNVTLNSNIFNFEINNNYITIKNNGCIMNNLFNNMGVSTDKPVINASNIYVFNNKYNAITKVVNDNASWSTISQTGYTVYIGSKVLAPVEIDNNRIVNFNSIKIDMALYENERVFYTINLTNINIEGSYIIPLSVYGESKFVTMTINPDVNRITLTPSDNTIYPKNVVLYNTLNNMF